MELQLLWGMAKEVILRKGAWPQLLYCRARASYRRRRVEEGRVPGGGGVTDATGWE